MPVMVMPVPRQLKFVKGRFAAVFILCSKSHNFSLSFMGLSSKTLTVNGGTKADCRQCPSVDIMEQYVSNLLPS